MKFLHYLAEAGPTDIVEVRLSEPANVLLLDPLMDASVRIISEPISHGNYVYAG
jgi:hypothetical protein